MYMCQWKEKNVTLVDTVTVQFVKPWVVEELDELEKELAVKRLRCIIVHKAVIMVVIDAEAGEVCHIQHHANTGGRNV
jgi:hypothetical protein